MTDFWFVCPDPDDEELPEIPYEAFRAMAKCLGDLSRGINQLFRYKSLRELLGIPVTSVGYTHGFKLESYVEELATRPRFAAWFDEYSPLVGSPLFDHHDLHCPSPRSGGCGGIPRDATMGVGFPVPITPDAYRSWQETMIKTMHKPP